MQNVSDLIFAAGMALPSPSTPIAVQYDLLLLTFVFREKDGIILDAEANMVCDITSTYLRYLLVGRCIYTDVDQIIWEIEHTYLGISRQALLVCVKDAYSKICERGSWLPGLRSPSRPSTVEVLLDNRTEFEYDNKEEVPCSRGGNSMKELPPTAVSHH